MANRSTDAESFEALAMPMFASLYNFAHWLTHNREEAEDLVQEAYLKALKGFASFQQGTNFRAWMYRILRNTFLTSRSGLSVKMTVPLDREEDAVGRPTDTPEAALLARADQQMLQSALERLPVQFREVILLCDVEEMSYQEIAEIVGIPIGTVMSRLSRARKSMRELLAEKRAEFPNDLRLGSKTRPVRRWRASWRRVEGSGGALAGVSNMCRRRTQPSAIEANDSIRRAPILAKAGVSSESRTKHRCGKASIVGLEMDTSPGRSDRARVDADSRRRLAATRA